jgi:hypothetical protein
MPGLKSTYLCNAFLALELGGTAWTPPSTWYMALFTVLPTAAGGGTEVSVAGYSRIAITNNTTNFPAPTTALVSNGVDIACGTPASSWGIIVGVALFDAASGGNMGRVFACSPSINAPAGVPLIIPAGSLLATEA